MLQFTSAPRTLTRATAGLGVLAALCAVLFVLAPVNSDQVSYSWPEPGGVVDTTLPLFPYQPERLDIHIDCAALGQLSSRSEPPSTELSTGTALSTAPVDNWPVERPSRSALTVAVQGDTASVRVGADPILSAPIGQDCAWRVHSDHAGTSVHVDGSDPHSAHTASRPLVLGFFTDLSPTTTAKLTATVTPDTEYQSSPTIGKIALGVVTVACLALMLVGLTRRTPRRLRLLPHRWWRPRPVDGVFAAGLAGWVLVGPLTVDDGYIVTMLKSGSDTGFIGNYFRWFNAPEAPFGWFYEGYRLLTEVSAAAPWLRLPSALLGLACWLIVDRAVLPRLTSGPARWARWTAAGGFLLWYLPFNIGLRPEPLVVLGILIVFVLAERAAVTGSVAALATAVMVAGATAAVTPTGIAAVLPLLASARSLFRALRHRSGVPSGVTVVALLAAGTSALLLMFYDQSLVAALEAIRVRTEIGPSHPPSAEPERYQRLLDPSMAEGSLGRRVPVLITGYTLLLTIALLLRRRAPGLRAGPGMRLMAATTLFPLVLVVTPTKWTHHFGALAGVGAVLLALFAHTVACGALRSWFSWAAALTGFTVVFSVCAAGPNSWWSASTYGVKWNSGQPHIGSIPAWELVLAAGGAVALLMVLSGLFRRGWATPRPSSRLLSGSFAGVVWLVVLFEIATMAYAIPLRWGTYSVGKSGLTSLTGRDCGVEDHLDVEPDPDRGALAEADGWHVLPPGIDATRTPPLTVPVTSTGTANVHVEFGEQSGSSVRSLRTTRLPASTEGHWRDLRLDPAVLAPDADRVRVTVEPSSARIGTPRLPVVVPLQQVVPAGERVAVDWPNAFLLPCRQPPSLDDGTVQPIRYRFAAGPAQRNLASGQQSAANGGPYAPLYGLARATELPTYLRGDSIREPVTVIKLDYVTPDTLAPSPGAYVDR